jgi:NADH dehydrogenase FAD-containing subunit
MLPLVEHAGAWVERGVEVTLLDAWDALYYSGMVPEYLGGVYSADEVRIDLRRLCAASGVAFRRARVASLSQDKTVVTEGGDEVGFDLAVFDIGSVTPQRDRAGGAVLTKPLHRIEALEAFVRSALDGGDGGGEPRDLVVVGGGAAGVEVLLNVSARASAVRPGALRFALVDPADDVLPGFPSGMQADVRRRLERRGVSLRFGAQAERVVDGGVLLKSGSTLPANCVLWATGTTGPALFRAAGLPVDGGGFLRVDDTMQCPATPWLFAAGDCAALASYPELKKIGVHAVKQGPVLRDNVTAALDALQSGRPLSEADVRAFTPYPVAPLILSTGDPTGLWASDRWWLRGGPVLRLKHFVDRRWMGRYTPQWHAQSLPSRFGREAASA